MPAGVFYIKKGDRLPALQAVLVDGNGNAVNLTGATVTFNMNDSTNTPVVSDAAATVVDAVRGIVKYPWGASDTTTAGTFMGEFAVVAAGLEQSFPNDGYITIVITRDLG